MNSLLTMLPIRSFCSRTTFPMSIVTFTNKKYCKSHLLFTKTALGNWKLKDSFEKIQHLKFMVFNVSNMRVLHWVNKMNGKQQFNEEVDQVWSRSTQSLMIKSAKRRWKMYKVTFLRAFTLSVNCSARLSFSSSSIWELLPKLLPV